VSYQAAALLTQDGLFQSRSSACATEQAEAFRNDQRPEWVATAEACLRGDAIIYAAFYRLASAGPGIADKADNGDGTVDQAKVTDADLLSLTQANWPTVAGLYFTEDGSPKP
jgi:hypothetical protein